MSSARESNEASPCLPPSPRVSPPLTTSSLPFRSFQFSSGGVLGASSSSSMNFSGACLIIIFSPSIESMTFSVLLLDFWPAVVGLWMFWFCCAYMRDSGT